MLDPLVSNLARAAVCAASLVVGSVAWAEPTDWREGLTPEQVAWVERTGAAFHTEGGSIEQLADMVRRGTLDTSGPARDTDWTAGRVGQCVVRYRALGEEIRACDRARDRHASCVEVAGRDACGAQAKRREQCVERLRESHREYDAKCAD